MRAMSDTISMSRYNLISPFSEILFFFSIFGWKFITLILLFQNVLFFLKHGGIEPPSPPHVLIKIEFIIILVA